MKKHTRFFFATILVCLLSVGSLSVLHLSKLSDHASTQAHHIVTQPEQVAKKGGVVIMNKFVSAIQRLVTQ